MIVARAACAALVLVITGLVLLRRLARLLFSPEGRPADRDLLLIGVLPGLALVGGVATLMAAAHLFYPILLLAFAAGIFLWAREDARALALTASRELRLGFSAARQGDLFAVLALLAAAGLLLCCLLMSQIPSENVDIWVFHLPLARSFIAYHGFHDPQMPNLFYASQPLLPELMFGLSMLAVDHYIAADAINIAIYFGLLLLLLGFARHKRGLQFLVIFAVFFWADGFARSTAEPMTDLPRSCFSVAAFLFAYRYAVKPSAFDLTVSGLLAGAAAASKYTELATGALIALTLLPLVARHRRWPDLLPACAGFLVLAAPWYLKNAILVGNPIFPFLFGHRGLTDAYMTAYLADITRPFDPADRIYSTNLLTLRGWHDFAVVLATHFSSYRWLAVIGIAGLALPRPRRWLLPCWTMALFIIWYAIMFNGIRWAVSAELMLMATALLSWFWAADWVLDNWNAQRVAGIVDRVQRHVETAQARAFLWLKSHDRPWSILSSCLLAALVIYGVVRLPFHHGDFLFPRWMNRDEAVGLVKSRRMEEELEKTRSGYVMYRYVAQHDLRNVFQPFDNGAVYDVASYNDAPSNLWILPYETLPNGMGDLDRFLGRNDIRYFIIPDGIDPVSAERMGSGRIALSWAVINRLRSHARAIFHDGKGMTLYKVEKVS
jgi:hypothetical protein